MDQAWVYNRHYLLHRNDFSVGSVLVSASFRFGGFGKIRQVRFGHAASVLKVRQVAVVSLQRCTSEPDPDFKNPIMRLLLRYGIVIFCFFRIRIRIQFWMITNDFNKLLVAY